MLQPTQPPGGQLLAGWQSGSQLATQAGRVALEREARPEYHLHEMRVVMQWTKPDFDIVEVTMEVTAYVARR